MTRSDPRPARCLVVVLLTSVALLLGSAVAADAAISRAEKLAVLGRWTQTSATSYDDWNDARVNRARWIEYGFDWSTDHCTASPDKPLGFDFRLPCHRHDFGYGNYAAVGQFHANKARLDDAFYADLKRRCVTYASISRPACYSLAWTYYNAAKTFGSLAVVDDADLDRAARLSPHPAAGLS